MIRLTFFLFAILSPANLLAQVDSIPIFIIDSTYSSFALDSSVFSSLNSKAYFPGYYYPSEITHNPTAEDEAFIESHQNLLYTDSSTNDLIVYYNLACSLWEVSRNEEAKTLFLKIIKSKDKNFSQTTLHPSVSGNDSSNYSGYGSFSSNYKHDASVYLAKIYIEEREYKKALKYLKLSQKKYKIFYSCGTGHRSYISEIYGLYGMAYAPLNKNHKIIKLFMPECFISSNDMLMTAIKNKYSSRGINVQLNKAKKKSVFKPYKEIDGIPQFSSCTTRLFRQKINLPYPTEHFLVDDQTVTRDMFILEFENSDFFKSITE
jgi:tetratricopeptide (TPR) repeat protein